MVAAQAQWCGLTASRAAIPNPRRRPPLLRHPGLLIRADSIMKSHERCMEEAIVREHPPGAGASQVSLWRRKRRLFMTSSVAARSIRKVGLSNKSSGPDPDAGGQGQVVAPARVGRLNGLLLVGLVLCYAMFACLTAARRPLWYDELVTCHLAALPDLKTFWSALEDGTDLNPPLHHLAVRAAVSLLGPGPLAVRVPSIVGFGIMVVCLYQFASRRVGRWAAWVAMLWPFTTRAYWYAFEARPYGLVLGFSALALWCWQAAAAGSGRPLVLLGLTVSLAAAISTHFYAVLVFLALALGELARSLAARRWNPAIWAAFALGAAPLALFRSVITTARSRSDGFWSEPSSTKCFDFYSWLISSEAIFPLIVFGLIAIGLVRLARPDSPSDGERHRSPESMPLHEYVAITAFSLIPILTQVMAKTVTNAFTERYALPAIIGLSLITATLVDWRARGRAAALLPALVLFCWVPFVEVLVYRRVAVERDAYPLLRRELEHEPSAGLPILVADARDYLQLNYQAPEPLASRLIFPRVEVAARGEASSAREVERLGHWVKLNIHDLAALQAAHPRFLVFGSAASGLVAKLEEPGSGAVVTARGPELFVVARDR
jgi:hypothetical protein